MPRIIISDYRSAKPFPHVVMDGPFIPPDLTRTAGRLLEEGSGFDADPLKAFAAQFRSSGMLELAAFISGIEDAELDTESHSGFEETPQCGEIVPRRDPRPFRLGVVAFFAPDWDDANAGHFELWSAAGADAWRAEKLIRPLASRIVFYDPSGWVRFAPINGERYVPRPCFRAFYRSRSRYMIERDRGLSSAKTA